MEKRWQSMLIAAEKNAVTDIHFLIQDDQVEIKMRNAQGMKEYPSDPSDLKVCYYLAYLSNLDLTDQMRPQSGAFSYLLYDKRMYFRYSMLTSLSSISFTLRILYRKVIKEEVSMLKEDNRIFNEAIRKDSGLILLSGPTGSGKTSTAYALLKKIKNREIYTIEDPIELPLDNAIQVQVNLKSGLTYAEGIRQLMRHDPDVIFIGEIRDENEAKMAIRAALTGHLVISTIHARNCVGVFHRLKDLNVNLFDLYETAILITNQRLLSTGEKKERVCVYETMDEEEILYYREHQQLSEAFVPLSEKRNQLSLPE